MMKEGAGVVATGHPLVSAAAQEILRSGGNAFDGVVAAGFAAAVAEPALTSLGGGGFLLARTASGDERLFDFFVDTPGRGRSGELEPHFLPVTVRFPGSEQDFNVGLGSVAVPGTLAGLLHVHGQLGRLRLAQVLAPAARLAREGVRLNARQSYFLGLLRPIMTLTEAGRALYAPSGSLLGEGDRLYNPDLARTLESLPDDGGESFYRGALASRVASDMDAGQGLLTLEDLTSFAVIEREPLAFPYRGRRVLTNPSPSLGGSLIEISLELLERVELDQAPWGSPEHLLALVGVMREVDELRADGCTATEHVEEDVLAAAAGRVRAFLRGTTHASVADAEGNVASMTTSNGEGSGYVVPGTGIMLNNMMGEDDLHPDGFHSSPPGLRVASMMSPSLVLEGEQPRLVVGSGGSKRIRSAMLQVISNVFDFGLPVREAVEAPRLHWDGEIVQAEPGFGKEGLSQLRAHGSVNLWPERDVYFGGVHAVVPGGQGAGDSRRGGSALVGD